MSGIYDDCRDVIGRLESAKDQLDEIDFDGDGDKIEAIVENVYSGICDALSKAESAMANADSAKIMIGEFIEENDSSKSIDTMESVLSYLY